MPIYDYKCKKCETVSEVLVRSSDGQTIKCSSCGSTNVEKLLSASYMIKMGGSRPDVECCEKSSQCDSQSCSSGQCGMQN